MAWLIFTLVIAAALMVGIERLIRRLGVERADPADAPHGLSQLVDHLRAWWGTR